MSHAKTLLVCFVFFLASISAKHSTLTNNVPYGPCYNKTLDMELINSNDMPAQIVAQMVDIPFELFWSFFEQANLWTSWNYLFKSISTTDFFLCGPLDAVYTNAPKLPFPPGITGPHHIIQKGLSPDQTEAAYAWFFEIYTQNGTMITFGRHTYTLQESGNQTLFSSYERAAGSLVSEYSFAWTVALQESLLDGVTGAVCLERVYEATGDLNPSAVLAMCSPFTP